MAERIEIPKFYIPDGVRVVMGSDEVEQYSHALRVCGSCGYVLCSCGGCHSQQCNDACSYEQTTVAEGVQS